MPKWNYLFMRITGETLDKVKIVYIVPVVSSNKLSSLDFRK